MDSEAKLIKRLARAVPSCGLAGDSRRLRLGIGDDAAILRSGKSTEWVWSCDSFLEGAHFLIQRHPAESIGYKSLARAVSDLAAMGASPRYFLLSLALPATRTGKWFDRFAAGMAQASRSLGIKLVGGDLAQNRAVTITVTVLGDVASGRAIERSGARPGDLIYVSGQLGAAQLGLELILRGLGRKPSLRKFLRPHLYPAIRVALGRWLAQRRIASAMLDLSDGLSTDLSRLCESSGVGAEIWVERIPRTPIPAERRWRRLDSLRLALHGGEDYELLFTVPPSQAKRLRRAPGGAKLSCIGKVTREKQILLIDSKSRRTSLVPRGWDHFKERP